MILLILIIAIVILNINKEHFAIWDDVGDKSTGGALKDIKKIAKLIVNITKGIANIPKIIKRKTIDPIVNKFIRIIKMFKNIRIESR